MADATTQTATQKPTWWQDRTAMERRLMLVGLVMLLVAVPLAVSLALFLPRWQHQPESLMPVGAESRENTSARDAQAPVLQPGNQSQHDICITQGCIHTASEVLSRMDPSVAPCDDFYRFSCGKYLRYMNIPDDKSLVDTFSHLSDQLLEKLRNAIEEKKAEAAMPRSLRLARGFYQACMNKPLIDSLGLEPLKRVLKDELGGWPVVEGESWDEAGFDWRTSVYRFRKAGHSIDYFFKLTVEPDYRNSTRRSIYLDLPLLGLSPELLMKGSSDEKVKAYYEYQVDLAVMLGANKTYAESELKQSLKFEIALANIFEPKVKQPYTVEYLQGRYPYVPWLEYLQTLLPPDVTISKDEEVVVQVPIYLMNLGLRLNRTCKSFPRAIANYVMWRAVEGSVRYMTEEMRERQVSFNFAQTGKKERQPRSKECVEILSLGMPLALGSIYVRRFFDEEAKRAALEMVDDIRQEFQRILRKVDWMDEGTREKALEKANCMVAHIAYPDELMDDSKLDNFYKKLTVKSTMYLESVLNVSKFLTDYSFSQLKQPINKTDWVTHGTATTINANYDISENAILFPAGILQGAFFSADRPRYMNYGGIGSVIGHEITHGFDNQGSRYDKHGNLVDWWHPATRSKFQKNAECMIAQYGNYTEKKTGLHLNGYNTLGENIADNGGIKQAYHAYLALERRSNKSESRLPALSHLSPRQMFWVSVAQTWCTKYRTEDLWQKIATEPHPLSRFRIVGPLSNRPEFAKDFGCPPRSHMNPVEKCQVW